VRVNVLQTLILASLAGNLEEEAAAEEEELYFLS